MMSLKINSLKQGFTLIETTLAMALIALSLGQIVDLQTIAGRRVMNAVQDIDRMLSAYDFLLMHMYADAERVEKTVAEYDLQLTYERTTPPADSRLEKEFNHMVLHRVSWRVGTPKDSMQNQLVYAQFVPPVSQDQPSQPSGQADQKPAQEVPKGPKESSVPPTNPQVKSSPIVASGVKK